jgi:acyl carrier protein
LTSNGKVDRKVLPDPEGTGMSQGEYVAPITDTEKKLVKIWSDVLGVSEEVLSITSDFFDLGGHSISAIKSLSLIFKQFGVTLSVRDILECNLLDLGNKIDYLDSPKHSNRKEIII